MVTKGRKEISDKHSIKTALRQSFSELVHLLNEINPNDFHQPLAENKWSAGEHLGHLILSTKALVKGLSIPKWILSTRFGKNNRVEKSFLQTKERYYTRLQTGTVKAPPNFVFQGANEKSKDNLIEHFIDQLNRLLGLLDQWNEKELSTYILPHPAIGKLTIREMMFFTIFHTAHHREIIAQQMREVALDKGTVNATAHTDRQSAGSKL